eukprot:TRINITY_DN1730_c0_g1_i1.p1 TRINITY_DN1730_c0_g1~~TRINITY_DN1730_c0_g1_i1.p1  ORF type:complete len:347 (-),score=81.56 TRINITY_DN1730_c0_g1_i1:179-1219(-)
MYKYKKAKLSSNKYDPEEFKINKNDRLIGVSKYGVIRRGIHPEFLDESKAKNKKKNLKKKNLKKKDSDETFVAIKQIKLTNNYNIDQATRFNINAIIDDLSNITSQYTIQYFGSIWANDYSECWIVMEFCRLRSLRDVMNKLKLRDGLKEKQIALIAFQVLKGLQIIQHLVGFEGYCLNPSNLLITSEGQLKLSNFGLGTFKSHSIVKQDVINSDYCFHCPEVYKNMIEKSNEKNIVWNLGITLLELSYGETPFLHLNSKDKTVNYLINSNTPSPSLSSYHDKNSIVFDFTKRLVDEEALLELDKQKDDNGQPSTKKKRRSLSIGSLELKSPRLSRKKKKSKKKKK